ncbi:MAG: ATP-binding cassette domain-containing protein [Candidatus Marinimicrobia bacterium]|nr:ATP-binding cassette domain-containing protein [Candidatus Neomarinimicrobiota bacterium]MCF7851008.1 ATP-binding cassette domain-containing protein [Candidatus Neomarinimicrobiota bacterium]MCF7904938.1 ATP-binding cassette domain-containing protein [Candidatus Neomarinimicrobiota bacterium]
MTELVHMDKAHLYYDTGISLRDLSLSIGQDEFVYLFGPSGSGKTSLLGLMYMELVPNTGTVTVLGYDTNRLKRKEVARQRKRIGRMFQDPRLLNDRDIYHNLALPLEISGFSGKDARHRVFQKADELSIRSRLNHFPYELSGGEKQRVALAMASIISPELMLVDEPTAQLDEESSRIIIDTLWKIQEAGTSVVFATHKEEVIQIDPARTITLNKGEIIQDKPR